MKKGAYLYRWMLWNVGSRAFVNFYLKYFYQFRTTKDSDQFPKPPFIVVGNHGTFFDPWIIGLHSIHPFAFMVNDDGFRGKGMSQWYLRSIGAFPKKKGASDFKAMKKTIELLNDKYPVCIFPEGQTTWDGETQLIYRGIEKILKKMKVPLVSVRFQGNFLTKPWWAHTIRKGRILVNVKVSEPSVMDTMTSDQVFDLIKSSIYQNDIKDEQNLSFPFKGRDLALGLERFVWICMHCGKEDTLTTTGDDIHCSSCNNTWHFDAHCRLSSNTPGIKCLNDLKDWSDMHKAIIKDKVISPEMISTETPAAGLLIENRETRLFDNMGPGTLVLDKNELHFRCGEKVHTWPVQEIEDYVVQKKDIFEFRHNETYYRILFSNKSPMKWVYYIRYLKGFQACEEKGYI